LRNSESCWFLLYEYITMHGPQDVKFLGAQQAKQIYQYKNTKEKLCKTNAAIWFNKICRKNS